jgi:hypothetical protein
VASGKIHKSVDLVGVSMNLPTSGKHFVMLVNICIVVSPSHGCQVATIRVVGAVGIGSATMTVAHHIIYCTLFSV